MSFDLLNHALMKFNIASLRYKLIRYS